MVVFVNLWSTTSRDSLIDLRRHKSGHVQYIPGCRNILIVIKTCPAGHRLTMLQLHVSEDLVQLFSKLIISRIPVSDIAIAGHNKYNHQPAAQT